MNSKKTYTVQKTIGDPAHSHHADHHVSGERVCR